MGDVMKRTICRKAFSVAVAFCMLFTMFPFIQNAARNGEGNAFAAYTHKISFYVDGYDNVSSDFPAISVSDNGSFTIPNKKPIGYTNFKGWTLYRVADEKFYAAAGGWLSRNQITSINDLKLYAPNTSLVLGSSWTLGGVTTSDYIFIAEETPINYSITYNTNGGTGNFPTQYVDFNSYFNISSTIPVNPGYTFKGWGFNRLSDNKWYTTYGGGWKSKSEIDEVNVHLRLYEPGLELKFGESCIKGETTTKGFAFAAQWEPKNYTISYDLNGGSGSFTAIQTAMRGSFTISGTKPTRSNCVFKGWNLVRNSDGKYYVAGEGWRTASQISSGNLTAKLYDPGTSLVFGVSMVDDGIDTSNFTFRALWAATVHSHSYSTDYTVDKQPTCTEDGSKSRHCTVCGAILESSVTAVPPLGHHYGDYETVKAATCTSEGVRKRTCLECGAVKTETIAKKAHSWDAGRITRNACTSDGAMTYTCTKCGETKTETISKTGHSWDSGTIAKPAKYFSTGVKIYTCEVCGSTKSVVIPVLDVAKVTPKRAKFTAAKVKGRNLTVKWKRIAKNTKGYQVALKEKKSGKQKYITVKQSKKKILSKTIKKLKKGKTYAVRIRAYNKIGSEIIYGPWSKVKSGKI